MSCVNCDPISMMRIRDVMSEFPLWSAQREKLNLLGVEIEDRCSRRAVQPAARFAWVHNDGIILRLECLLVGKAMHDNTVRFHRALLHVGDVVNEENLVSRDVETVRRLEDLEPEPGARAREQSLRVPVVFSEDAGERHVKIFEWLEGER